MKELVLYYSYSGNTKKRALETAAKYDLTVCEVVDEVRPGKFAAYTKGCYQSIKGIATPIQPLSVNFAEFSTALVYAPIWAGSIAPAMNAALAKLPAGTKVSLRLVSGGGHSNKAKITERLKSLGLEIVGYEDLRG